MICKARGGRSRTSRSVSTVVGVDLGGRDRGAVDSVCVVVCLTLAIRN
ncbi:hypothetical protein HBB16_18900, partial [Pseudonocardia sp. MCCB 268]|nr:hypothetical protein [Pseudonocardia cytotoxica]